MTPILLALSILAAEPAQAAAPPAEPHVDWTRPMRDVDHTMRCYAQNRVKPVSLSLKLKCLSAAGDHVDHCRIVASSAPVTPELEAAMECIAQRFSIGGKDESGRPLIGAPIVIPWRVNVR